MGFGIDRVARSRKAKGGVRALFGGRAPSAAEVGDRLARLAKRMWKGAVIERSGSAGPRSDAEGGRGVLIDASPKRVTLQLVPGARPVRLAVVPSGDIEVHGDTTALGPGYYDDACARLAALWDELEYAWVPDETDVRAGHLAWLAGVLRDAGRTRVRIGMPTERSFVVDAPVLTALGPRDRAWRDAVIADPAKGADAFPWWESGPGTGDRARALVAMWHEVAWRAPLDHDELALLERVHGWLAAAYRANPALALPWPEWKVIVELIDDPEVVDAALAKTIAARAGAAPATIGYRRYELDAEISGGWSLRMPGSFLGGWTDDDSRYIATDGERSLELTTLTANGSMTSAELLAVAPEKHPVVARLDRGEHEGRAEAYDEDGVSVVHGIVTSAPHIAILTCKGEREWALSVWRTLRRT